MNPTEADPFVNKTSPVTPLPALFAIAGNPTACVLKCPLPFNDNATTLDVASNKISVVDATDQLHDTNDNLGSVDAPVKAEASKILAAEFVDVVVTLITVSKSESLNSCVTNAMFSLL
jgi:hypothetical protein|tara:strand:- start:1083 stop:1436 length:354 start_codon:yes stop_codon:yes gene_type:complete